MTRGPPPNLPRRLTLVLGCSQLLAWSTTFYLPAVIAGVAADSLGASRVAIVGGFSWALLVTGICAPRVGRRIDRTGGRLVLAASSLVLAAGLVVLATARGLPQWYVGWTVLGAGMSLGLYDAAFATIGRLLGRGATPVITGVTLFAGFASTLGWPAGSYLVDALGWRETLLIYAGLQVAVNLPLCLLGVPAAVPETFVESSAVAPPAGRTWRVALACLAGFFSLRWLLSSAITVFILPLLAGLGMSLNERLFVAALIGPGQVAGRLVEWGIGPRVNLLLRARGAAALMPLGVAVLLLGGPVLPTVVAGAAFALLYGMSNGMLTINRGTLPMAIFGPAGYATLLGWLAVPVLLAQASAPTLAAPLIEALPPDRVFLVIGLLSAAAIVLLLPLRLPQGAR